MEASNTLTPPVNDADHSRGPQDAPVTLVEFGDYQCPYCGMMERGVQQVLQRMGDQVRFVFRNFPLPQHENAWAAAEVAEAAGGQGKFWEMHDALFAHQQALSPDDLLRYAADLGLDLDRLRADLQAGKYDERIEQDARSGEESGIPGTPTFFINGEPYGGDLQPQALIDALQERLG